MSLHLPAPARRVVAPSPLPRAKAGPVGPGAGPLMTEYLLPTVLSTDAQQKMSRALKIGHDVDWIRAAERAIYSKIVGCEWHIEDPDGETIDDEYQGERAELAIQAYTFLTNPQGEIDLKDVGRRMTRRQLLTVTSRQMGICGNAAWMYDMRDNFGVPHAILYIRPDRLTPICNKAGVLQGWVLDKKPGDPGTPIAIEDLSLLQFEPPDVGVFGVGLIESAIAKAINNGLIDRHYSALLASGGRISGIIAPKEGAITDDGVFKQLERDWRNVVEQPEAARRAQIVRAPVEFTSTVMGVGEMQIIDLMYHNRDALLALWGVPLSQLGGTAASGLNSGETRKYDEAALWQGAVHDRLEEIGEAYQAVLDMYEPILGYAPTFCWDEPEQDDDTPAFDRAQKAAGMPLRNKERRALVGLEPFDDPALDNAIWMPVNVVSMAMAPDEDGNVPDEVGVREVSHPESVSEEPGETADETPAVRESANQQAPTAARGGTAKASLGKATAYVPNPYAPPIKVMGVLDTGVRRLRDRVDETVVPRLTRAVEAGLKEQRDAIAAAVEAHWSSIVLHGGRDETMWWRPGSGVEKAIKSATGGVSEAVSTHIADALN